MERPNADVVLGRLAPRVPFRPDRAGAPTPVHDAHPHRRPRPRAPTRRHAHRLGRERRLVERRQPAVGARRRSRLVRTGLDRARRERSRAADRPRHQETRPRTETTLPDRSCLGRRRRSRPARPECVGVRLGRRCHRRRHRVPRPLGIGLVPGCGRPARPHHSDGHDAVRADMADGRSGALTRRRPCRGRRGLRERPRLALRQRHRDRHAHHRQRDLSLAGPADGGPGIVVRRRFPLVLEHRRDPDRLRPDLAGRSAGGAVARRRLHRRRRDHARLRDHRGRRRRMDHSPGPRTPAGARPIRSSERHLEAAHRIQRPHRRRPRVSRRPHDPVGRRGRHRRSRVCS